MPGNLQELLFQTLSWFPGVDSGSDCESQISSIKSLSTTLNLHHLCTVSIFKNPYLLRKAILHLGHCEQRATGNMGVLGSLPCWFRFPYLPIVGSEVVLLTC